MIIIPAIDVYNNRTVRLEKGKFDNVTYYPNSPFDQAKLFVKHGFKRIHIVNLAGSVKGEVTIGNILQSIKTETQAEIEFGGGIRNKESVETLFNIGIDRIIIGSLSIKNKSLFESLMKEYDPARFIISVDVLDKMVAVHGWTETTNLSLSEHIQYCLSLGLKQFLCTDISKDGMLTGTNSQLYAEVMAEFPGIELIASGGVKDIEDIKKIQKMNMYAAVVGKAIYENKISIEELASIAE
jgi:phosphoribosylformimino-5-aminoimidazole carboxamide ribotide isomerase